MRNKKNIEAFDKLVQEVELPKRNSTFESLEANLRLVIAENLGSSARDLRYSQDDQMFYFDLEVGFRTKSDIYIRGQVTFEIDPRKPLMPQIDSFIKTKVAIREESDQNQQEILKKVIIIN